MSLKNGVKHAKLSSLLAMTVAATMLFPNTTVNAGIVHKNVNATIAMQAQDSAAHLQNEKWVSSTLESVKAGETCYYTNAAQIARFVQTAYCTSQVEGPFSITKGVLNPHSWLNKKSVYVVALSGTDTKVFNQTTGVITDVLAGLEKENGYLKNVKKAMLQTVPKGANVILTGHSLGGMVAQQIAADKEIKDAYKILNTVTFGSPLIDGFDREGTVKRLGDNKDMIPYCSISTVLNIFWQSWGLSKEDGGYNDGGEAHVLSYQREDVWGRYDVTGIKDGNNTLLMDFGTTRYFKSPVI